MDVLDLFFKKYSYKFSKGYPDMNNDQDILLLENILNELDIKISFNEVKKPIDFLSDEAKKITQNVIQNLNISADDIKALSKNKIVILSDKRQKIFSELEKLGYKRDSNISGSSQGGFRTDNNIEILVKPKSAQGEKSAGKQNESSFLDLINNKVKENDGPITVIIQSDKKKIKFNNIEEAKDSSVEGATQFAKADAQLVDDEGEVIGNISLKKRNAVRWESSKTREIDGINVFKNFIQKVSNNVFPNVSLKPLDKKNKFKLYNPQTNKVLSKVIIKNTPSDVVNDVIFGNDVPKTIVIKEDFENFSNYTFENGVLVINCYKIYTDVKDIMGTDDEPVYAFSNHIGQAYGIEFRSFSKGLLYKDDSLKGSSEEIDFKDLK
jgi:hypothetical protein